jgi:hypothetical protein
MISTPAFRAIRHKDHVELRQRIADGLDYQAIATEIARYHLSWNRNTESTRDVATSLLADAMRFWGLGSVKGVFRTTWYRTGSELVVKTSWLARWGDDATK